MLIIFDVDGTLIGGETWDWRCLDEAIESVLGFRPDGEFFRSLTEITAQALAEAAIRAAKRKLKVGLEERIRDGYLDRLRKVGAAGRCVFAARKGVVKLLKELEALNGAKIAIATGDWYPTASLKLAAAGIDVSGYPIATSSDHRSRAEIIKLAAQRAGQPLNEAVYVGDALWDLNACKALGIQLIATGPKSRFLAEAGAEHALEELEPGAFVDVLASIFGTNQRLGPSPAPATIPAGQAPRLPSARLADNRRGLQA